MVAEERKRRRILIVVLKTRKLILFKKNKAELENSGHKA